MKPVVEAILKHPQLYTGPRMMKPPVVQVAGMHRARRRRVDTEAWTWLSSLDGQRLFYPPNVAGWNDDRWLDTSSFRGRWMDATTPWSRTRSTPTTGAGSSVRPGKLVDRALAFWGNPTTTTSTRTGSETFAQNALDDAGSTWKRARVPRPDRQRPADALRRLPRLPDLLSMSCSCNEFSRAAALRRSVAEAGRGPAR